MSVTTNSLVARVKKFVIPFGSAAALLLTISFAINHSVAHAAAGAAMPMDDSSVSSLVALDNAVEAVAARVTPAVVNVSVTAKSNGDDAEDDQHSGGGQGQMPPGFQFFFGPNGPMHGMKPQQPQIEHGIGSGIIVSPDGYIVTCNHVVDGATQLRVTLDDRRVFPAKVVGVDKLNDLAVIKIDDAKNLTSIAWGDSTKLHPGQTVLAFGNPFGNFPFTVTRGIVSGLNRPNPYSTDARRPGAFIQTDAAINQGNSGGPLVNAHGELVGINDFIISGSGSFAGAGFAVPTQIVKSSVDQIIKNGKVEHGYLGISMNDVTPENASFFNLPDATGALVSQVTPDSPASKAGLKSGDVLRELNGSKIANGSALQVAVSQTRPGNAIELGILRDGKPQTIKVTVGEFNANKEVASNSGGDQQKHGKIGISVDNISPDLRSQMNIPSNVKGAAVQSVRPGSPADDAGLSPGDVIMEVNRKPVPDAEALVGQLHDVPTGKDVLLLVWSHGGASYRVVHAEGNADSGM